MNHKTLFSDEYLTDFIKLLHEGVKRKIYGESREYLLNVNEEDYINHLVSNFTIEPITIEIERIETSRIFEQKEQIQDAGMNFEVMSRYIEFAIPYSGNNRLLGCHPPTSSMTPPRVILEQDELKIILPNKGSGEEIKNQVNKIFAQINQHLDWQYPTITKWNSDLSDHVRNVFKIRKKQFLDDLSIVQATGFPLRKRANAPLNYAIPIKKRLTIQRPRASSTQKYIPHPEIDSATYEDILSNIRNMSLAIERTPKAYEHMDEEQIRSHFLVFLNANYEGNATGETFSVNGKSDILLRYESRSVFIAECKFWKGAKAFLATIDQLLSYLT